LQRGAIERARGPAPLNGDRFSIQGRECIRNLDSSYAHGLPINGRVVDAAPGRELLDEGGNFHTILEHANLRQLGLIHRPPSKRQAKCDDFLCAGGNIRERNELDIDAARRLGRCEELGRKQVTSFQLLDCKFRS
jgi:hypothetical protein